MFERFIPAEWAARVNALAPPEFWIGALLLVALALGAFYAVFRFVHRVRIIEGTPTSRIRSAAQGYVELDGIGRLMRGQPVRAPLTGTICTWYSFKIEEKDESGESSSGGGRHSRWRTVRSGVSDDLFLLVDETGECVIDPDGAEVTPAISEVWYGNDPAWSGSAPQRRRFGVGSRYRFTERRMHPDDPLYAIGQFHSVGGSQELPDTHEEVRQLLAQWKRDQAGLHARFDRNGDGLLDHHEWDQVRQAARREVLQAQAERARGPVHHLMVRPEDRRRPFLLSVLPQTQLLRRYRLYAAAAMALFLLGGAGATWFITVRMVY